MFPLPFKRKAFMPLRQLVEAQQLVEAWQANDSPGRFSPSPALFEGVPVDEVMPGGRIGRWNLSGKSEITSFFIGKKHEIIYKCTI
jgi:hypothetical protein